MTHFFGSTSKASGASATPPLAGSAPLPPPALGARGLHSSVIVHGTLNGFVILKRSATSCATMCEPKKKRFSSSE